MTLLECMTLATREGFKVSHDPEEGGFWITTPKRPRRPSQYLGAYKTERDAWVGAAHLATLG